MATQQMRFNEGEIDLIKRTFLNNEVLLKAVRKVMLQLPLDVIDQTSLLVFKKDELMILMRKVFLPELDGNVPLGQQIDLWMTVNFDGKSAEESHLLLIARQKLIDYIDQQLDILNDTEKVGKLRFSEYSDISGKKAEEVFTNMIVRNTMVGHVENQLLQLNTLANQKSETPEEKSKRLEKDSNI